MATRVLTRAKKKDGWKGWQKMRRLDCRGMSGSDALAAIRKALEEMESPLEVVLAGGENPAGLCRMLRESGYKCRLLETPQEIKLTVTGKIKEGGGKAVWLITSRTLGRGDEELGLALMKSFLHTLAQTEDSGTIYFLNSGVKLCAGPGALVEYMQELEARRWRLECCGTCLDYFGIKDQVKVGSVTGMKLIVQGIGEADKVVTL
jgi:selenium metabolism protein YedF